jgi:lipid-binding SYLF domain-containing protein
LTTPEALRTFEETRGLELGAGVALAVADIGASGQMSSSTLQKPLIVFVWGEAGRFAGVNAAGLKITEHPSG